MKNNSEQKLYSRKELTMKYKVVDLYSDYREETTGTCELCFGTAYVENGYITLEDENGKQYEIALTVWDWGDFDTIYIDNVINFSAWLQNQDLEPITEDTYDWSWLANIVEKYDDETVEDENG